MENIKRFIPIIAISFIIVFLAFDIKSSCHDIDSVEISKGKAIYKSLTDLEKEYKAILKQKEKILKGEYKEKFKKYGAEKDFNQINKKLQMLYKEINKKIVYLKNPEKFQEENCSNICIRDEDSCNQKYQALLQELKKKKAQIETLQHKLKRILNEFKFAVEHERELSQIFNNLVIDIDQKIKFMEKVISDYKNKYKFNAEEIEKRGKFYIERLKKEKDIIQKYLTAKNYYQLVKYCKLFDFKDNIKTDCIKNGLKEFVNINEKKKQTKCKEEIDLQKICYSKVAVIFKEFTETFKELDKDFFVILLDKKAEYRATFSVYSWDESKDYPEEHVRTLTIKIPRDLYLKLREFVQRYGYDTWVCKYYGNLDCRIPELRDIFIYLIQNTPHLDNAYELYIEDLYEAYYHKYLFKGDLYKNSPSSKWVEVDEEIYNLFNEPNRIVMVKPKGYFGDQIIIKPQKIYKSLVGNNTYGYYQDGTWHWLPMYLFLFRYLDNLYYSRNKNIPPYMKDEILNNYFSRKKVLRDYAKKYGLCKNKECETTSSSGSSGGFRGGLRGKGSRYRSRGYGGLGK